MLRMSIFLTMTFGLIGCGDYETNFRGFGQRPLGPRTASISGDEFSFRIHSPSGLQDRSDVKIELDANLRLFKDFDFRISAQPGCEGDQAQGTWSGSLFSKIPRLSPGIFYICVSAQDFRGLTVHAANNDLEFEIPASGLDRNLITDDIEFKSEISLPLARRQVTSHLGLMVWVPDSIVDQIALSIQNHASLDFSSDTFRSSFDLMTSIQDMSGPSVEIHELDSKIALIIAPNLIRQSAVSSQNLAFEWSMQAGDFGEVILRTPSLLVRDIVFFDNTSTRTGVQGSLSSPGHLGWLTPPILDRSGQRLITNSKAASDY